MGECRSDRRVLCSALPRVCSVSVSSVPFLTAFFMLSYDYALSPTDVFLSAFWKRHFFLCTLSCRFSWPSSCLGLFACSRFFFVVLYDLSHSCCCFSISPSLSLANRTFFSPLLMSKFLLFAASLCLQSVPQPRQPSELSLNWSSVSPCSGSIRATSQCREPSCLAFFASHSSRLLPQEILCPFWGQGGGRGSSENHVPCHVPC